MGKAVVVLLASYVYVYIADVLTYACRGNAISCYTLNCTPCAKVEFAIGSRAAGTAPRAGARVQ